MVTSGEVLVTYHVTMFGLHPLIAVVCILAIIALIIFIVRALR